MYVHKYGHCILAYRFLEEILGLFGEDVLLRGIFPILEDYVSDFQFQYVFLLAKIYPLLLNRYSSCANFLFKNKYLFSTHVTIIILVATLLLRSKRSVFCFAIECLLCHFLSNPFLTGIKQVCVFRALLRQSGSSSQGTERMHVSIYMCIHTCMQGAQYTQRSQ